ncbi:MAG: hypothetical protein ACK5LJ_08095 [Paracoccus sp. (in: a-proteobacteria)]
MAMQKNVTKKKKEQVGVSAAQVEKAVADAMDDIASEETPFLHQDGASNIAIVGDASRTTKKHNDTVYRVKFVLPKSEYDINDYEPEDVSGESASSFIWEVNATQEEITPHTRTFYTTISVDFLTMFLQEVTTENGGRGFEFVTDQTEFANRAVRFYRTTELLENTKYFMGMLLGIDQEYIPYIHEYQLIQMVIDLISKNPDLMNESYFLTKH